MHRGASDCMGGQLAEGVCLYVFLTAEPTKEALKPIPRIPSTTLASSCSPSILRAGTLEALCLQRTAELRGLLLRCAVL